jgi:hypothetical protein
MSGREYGPSWAEVAEMFHYLWNKHSRRTEFKLVPPIRRVDGTGNSPGCAVATARPRYESEGKDISATASYGRGGTHQTAPGAFLAALAELAGRLEKKEEAVAKQSRLL